MQLELEPVAAAQAGEVGRAGPLADDALQTALARRRAFVFPSSDIYGGLGSSYDYGHYGVLLKQNVKAEWQRSLIQEREDVVLLETPGGGGYGPPAAG